MQVEEGLIKLINWVRRMFLFRSQAIWSWCISNHCFVNRIMIRTPDWVLSPSKWSATRKNAVVLVWGCWTGRAYSRFKYSMIMMLNFTLSWEASIQQFSTLENMDRIKVEQFFFLSYLSSGVIRSTFLPFTVKQSQTFFMSISEFLLRSLGSVTLTLGNECIMPT